MTVFNMVNCLVGSGILGLPYALKVGGWLGLVVMLMSTIVTGYSGKIIGKSIDFILDKYPGQNRDRYQDMAELCMENRVLGRLFKGLINVSIVLELWGAACSRIILQGYNLAKVFPYESEEYFMVMCTIILLPSVFIGMEWLAYMSMVGVVTSLSLLIGILGFGLIGQGVHPEDTILVDVSGLPVTFGVILFSYSGHAVFPQIYRAMADKSTYPQAVDGAFTISIVFYALMAAGGYLCWGSEVMDQVTLNLPDGILSNSLVLLMVFNNMLSYPLIMTAPIEATEDAIGLTSLRFSNPTLFFPLMVICRCMLVFGTLAVALSVSNFAIIATFIGSVFTISMSLIFPTFIYLKLYYFNLPKHLRNTEGIGCWEIMWNVFIIVLGIFGMVTGVASIFATDQ